MAAEWAEIQRVGESEGVFDLMKAAGEFRGQTTECLAAGIYDVPVLLNGFGFGADGHGFHDGLQQNQVNKKRNDNPYSGFAQALLAPVLAS